jgi:hypothetical protein
MECVRDFDKHAYTKEQREKAFGRRGALGIDQFVHHRGVSTFGFWKIRLSISKFKCIHTGAVTGWAVEFS